MNRTDIINTNERFLNNSDQAADENAEYKPENETLENLYLNHLKIDSLYEYLEFLKQYDEELEKQ